MEAEQSLKVFKFVSDYLLYAIAYLIRSIHCRKAFTSNERKDKRALAIIASPIAIFLQLIARKAL